MAGTVEKKLGDLGITLGTPAAPVANYVGFVRSGNLLVVSGQLCFGAEGKLVAVGKLGGAVSIEDGQKAARQCADLRGDLAPVPRLPDAEIFFANAGVLPAQPGVFQEKLGERIRRAGVARRWCDHGGGEIDGGDNSWRCAQWYTCFETKGSAPAYCVAPSPLLLAKLATWTVSIYAESC